MTDRTPPTDAQLIELCSKLPSHDREGQIFWRLRLQMGQSHLRYLLANARLRTALVVGLSLFFWFGLFALFYKGFDFVIKYVESPGSRYHSDTMLFVFPLFFLSLQVMLIFSSGIILYGGLYPSRETAFLMTLPVRDERLVFYRFQESLVFSSWGFFLLASPMLLAYGLVAKAPWYYFAYLLPLMASFAYIPCTIGAICCLLLIYRLPNLRRIAVGVAALAIIVVAYQSIWNTLEFSETEFLGNSWFKDTLKRFRFARGEWLPSTWLSNALIEAVRRSPNNPRDLPWLEAGKYLVVLVSNALVLHLAFMWLGKRCYRVSYWELHSRRAKKPKLTLAWIDRVAAFLLRPFPVQTKLLIMKDLRLFRRDPVQWSQFLIFFGLLLLYFANVDRFRQHKSDINVLTWVNIVSFLNLAVVGLILSTFTTRFIYPLISLEGRRFWILSRLPVERDTILWGKFLFAACGSWLPCAALVGISDVMLDVSFMVVAVHQLICLLLCLGLAGMAVGFGAMMPNFREQSPSKIAAGFGGTLNLVLSALYIMAVVLMTALPCHFYLLAGKAEMPPKLLQPQYLRFWLMLGILASMILAAIVTILPLRGGLKAFRRLEV
ncbi:putative ABC transporter permease subunit [Lacipirellula sp.]|uniref:putative ABC transporter permease subunit n=1 Tax=Lacipirellula sp. TaxID=2691419 RepID=UPI003D104E4B